MRMPQEPPPSQRALELLCAWLGATTRSDSDKCFRAYYKFILSPATRVKRFVEIRYRFDEDLTSEALQDLFLDHLERLGARQAHAEDVERLLEPTWIAQCSMSLQHEMEQWAADVRRAVVDVMQSTQREIGVSLADLEARAHACNERIRVLRDAGAEHLIALMQEYGVELALKLPQTDADALANAKDGRHGAADPAAASTSQPGRSSRALRPSAAYALDRLFSRMKGLDHDRQKAELFRLKRLAHTGLAANAPAHEVFLRLGVALFKLARVRLPMLGQVYSIARFAAVDSARSRSRMASLDAIAEHSSSNEGGIGADDIGQLAGRGGFRTQLVDGDVSHVYVDDGSAMHMLEDLERKIRQRSLKDVHDAGLAKQAAKSATSENDYLDPQALRGFDLEVQQLSESGLTLSAIADELGRDREQVRGALDRIRCSFDLNVFELDTAGYTQEEIADEFRTTRDRVRSALSRIDEAIGRTRNRASHYTDGQGAHK